MGFKTRALLFCALAAAAIIGCAKNNEQHAPVCPYGQVLAYTTSGYSCNFVSLNSAGYYGSMYPQQVQSGPVQPGQVLTPPIQACPGGQILVNWSGTWLCYWSDTIYPSGGNSPQTPIPPTGRGGEYCTGGNNYGYSNYSYTGYQNPAYYNYMDAYSVVCSPGYTCQIGSASAAPSASPYNGYNTAYTGGYGQAGTCVYSGYHGSY